ncbi:MAG: ribbon-helix-helix domain-containing protein [Candidatus Dormiibacterota bacterium]
MIGPAASEASSLVIPSYTGWVKTAISLPDATFERVNKRAAALHLSRSEFFARAAEQYLDQLESWSITDEIDEVVEQTKDDSGAAAVAAGLRRLAESDDEW